MIGILFLIVLNITEDSMVFVEVRQRYEKTIQKRMITIPYRDAMTLCNEHRLPDEYDGKDRPVMKRSNMTGFTPPDGEDFPADMEEREEMMQANTDTMDNFAPP